MTVDAYLDAVSKKSIAGDFHQFDAAIRALDLAVLLRDGERIELARTALMTLHRTSLAQNDGLWWRAFDRLAADKRTRTTQAELTELVRDLERLAAKFSNTTSTSDFNPHAAESAANRLIKHYSRQQDAEAAKKMHALVGAAFEHFAGMGDAMLASMVLQTSMNAYRTAGRREDAERTRLLMQSKTETARHEMKRFDTSVRVPKEDLEIFLDSVVLPELGSTFARIAASFLPDRSDLEAQVQKTLTDAPLMARISQEIVSGNRVIATVGSVEEDPFGRLIHHASTLSGLEAFWLDHALIRMRERHEVFPEHIVGWANRLELFPDVSLLLEGVYAWFEGDLTKALHVLVPQVENGLRMIASKLGKPTTKAHPTIPRASVAIGMGDILYTGT